MTNNNSARVARVERDVHDVVVVGGGLAGLVAAHELTRSGLDVRVLEARAQVGGRTRTIAVPGGPQWPGAEIDLGAQWIGPGQDRVAGLVRELGLATHRGEAAPVVVRVAGHARTTSRSVIGWPGWRGAADLVQLVLRLGWQARRVPLDRPWDTPGAEHLDRLSAADWLRRTAWTEVAASEVRAVVESGMCVPADEVSALEVLAQLRSVGGPVRLSTADSRWLPGGSQAIAVGLARRLGDRVVTGFSARRIVTGPGPVTVEGDGVSVRARRVVVALPPQVAAGIGFDPSLPAERLAALRAFRPGRVVKAVVGYPRRWWKDRGLGGTAVTDGPIEFVRDVSPPAGRPGLLVALASARNADALLRLDEMGRRDTVESVVERCLGPAPTPPVIVEVAAWNEEALALGGYASRFGVGGWIRHGRHWRNPVGPVHFAGTETATVWRSYMEGAAESGMRVAGEVVAALGDPALPDRL